MPAVDDESGEGTRKPKANSARNQRQAPGHQWQVGDIVEAKDPVTHGWSAATVHAFGKNGLIAVRWDDPGFDARGQRFHPIGEVWAEQLRRKSTRLRAAGSRKEEHKEEQTVCRGQKAKGETERGDDSALLELAEDGLERPST